MNAEYKISLNIYDFTMSLDEVTDIMGLTPTRAWLKGDMYTAKKNELLPRRNSAWMLDINAKGCDSIEQAIDKCYAILAPHLDGLHEMAKNGFARIFVGVFYGSLNGGFMLSPNALDELHSLGIAIDFDIYFTGDE